jgi:hypothetical protein
VPSPLLTTDETVRVSIGAIMMRAILCAIIIGTASVSFSTSAKPDEPAVSIILSRPLVFQSGEVSGRLSREQVERLLDESLLIGNHEPGVKLTSARGGDQKIASTCREWSTLLSEDYFAKTTYDMHMQSEFIITCLTLRALANARPAGKSFISDPRVGVHDIDLLPASLLPGISESDGERIKDLARHGETYATLARHDAIKSQIVRNGLRVVYNDMGQDIEEIARGADFDGDGIEDLLVVERNYVLSGSFTSTDLVLLSRTTPTAKFSVSSP